MRIFEKPITVNPPLLRPVGELKMTPREFSVLFKIVKGTPMKRELFEKLPVNLQKEFDEKGIEALQGFVANVQVTQSQIQELIKDINDFYSRKYQPAVESYSAAVNELRSEYEELQNLYNQIIGEKTKEKKQELIKTYEEKRDNLKDKSTKLEDLKVKLETIKAEYESKLSKYKSLSESVYANPEIIEAIKEITQTLPEAYRIYTPMRPKGVRKAVKYRKPILITPKL